MGHGTKINGVQRDITGGMTRVNGVQRKITKGLTLVNGVQREIAFAPAGTPIGDQPVGTSVYADVNGVQTEFLIVHQGKPSSLYDNSCDGTWLLAKDIYELRQWNSSNVNDYANSTIHSYLNSTFLGFFSAKMQSKIKQVKIPYRKGSGSNYSDSSVGSGSKGLSSKIFLLACYEVGGVYDVNLPVVKDGACLSYFSGTATTDSKRSATYNGAKKAWHLRTPTGYGPFGETRSMIIASDGSWGANLCTSEFGVRPAFILPTDTPIDENFEIIA